MRLYDTAELAALLGVKQGTLRTYRDRGLPGWLAGMPDQLYTVGGRPTWTWDADAIDAWLPGAIRRRLGTNPRRTYDTAELAALLGLKATTLVTYRFGQAPGWLADMPKPVRRTPAYAWDAEAIDPWLKSAQARRHWPSSRRPGPHGA